MPRKKRDPIIIRWGATGFVYQPSFFSAVQYLPEHERHLVQDAIITYGFTGKKAQLPPALAAILEVCIPVIESSLRSYQSGNAGGRPHKAETESIEDLLEGVDPNDPNLPY
jgi:hypothetical protein